MFAEKISSATTQHRCQARGSVCGAQGRQHRGDNTGALVCSTDFTNTYYHPNPAHVRRKNAVFDGRVLIDLGTYQSLDEDQREMLKEHGLVVNIVNSQ